MEHLIEKVMQAGAVWAAGGSDRGTLFMLTTDHDRRREAGCLWLACFGDGGHVSMGEAGGGDFNAYGATPTEAVGALAAKIGVAV